MMGTAERLAYMANQIARNFATLGETGAATATAEHIASFWDPRMKRQILARAESPDHGLEPSALGAIELLRERLAAAGTDYAERSDGG